MNAAEFASRLLDLIASAVPEEATVSKRLEGEIDALIEEFTAMPEPVLKLDEDRRMVYGWASVISKNGTPIIDRQGDVVTTDELRSAVHDFMKHRTAGDMHGELGVGEVVESFVLDRAVQKSLGIDLGIEGWYVGVHVPNDEVWEKVKDGTYGAFSIGGSAVREAISDEEAAGYTVVKGYKTLNDGTPDGDAKCPKCGKKPCCCGKKKMRKSDGSVGKAQRRHPKGSPQGGEFAPSGGGKSRGKGAKKAPVKSGAAWENDSPEMSNRRFEWNRRQGYLSSPSSIARDKAIRQAARGMSVQEIDARMEIHLANGKASDRAAYNSYKGARMEALDRGGKPAKGATRGALEGDAVAMIAGKKPLPKAVQRDREKYLNAKGPRGGKSKAERLAQQRDVSRSSRARARSAADERFSSVSQDAGLVGFKPIGAKGSGGYSAAQIAQAKQNLKAVSRMGGVGSLPTDKHKKVYEMSRKIAASSAKKR